MRDMTVLRKRLESDEIIFIEGQLAHDKDFEVNPEEQADHPCSRSAADYSLDREV